MRIVLDVRRALEATGTASADETDRFRMVDSPQGVDHHQNAPVGRAPQAPKTCFGGGVPQVGTVEGIGIEKDSHGLIEGDAMLLRVGVRLSRVPIEDDLSIYVIARPEASR